MTTKLNFFNTYQRSAEESPAREAGCGWVQAVSELEMDHGVTKMIDKDDDDYLGGPVTTDWTFATHAAGAWSSLDMPLTIAT